MIYKFKLTVLLLFVFTTLFAQESKLISSDVRFYKVDEIGNVYFVDSKNTLTKYEPNIPRYTRFADLKSGRIHSIDVSNPLRVLVFYADQSIVRLLDVNLTEINFFDIKKTYSQGWIRLSCSSNNNGIWMYDELNRKLLKFGQELTMQVETGDLYLITRLKINPNFIVEFSDELYLNDPKLGVLVFDLFGGFKRVLPITGVNEFTVYKKALYYEKNAELLKYDALKTDTLLSIPEDRSAYGFSNQYIYYLNADKLYQTTTVKSTLK